jgi:hypothetical protein
VHVLGLTAWWSGQRNKCGAKCDRQCWRIFQEFLLSPNSDDSKRTQKQLRVSGILPQNIFYSPKNFQNIVLLSLSGICCILSSLQHDEQYVVSISEKKSKEKLFFKCGQCHIKILPPYSLL